MPTERLIETTYSPGAQVDRDAGVIRRVKVIGRESRNGRTYSDNALSQAAKLYEGLKVHLDHAPRNDPDKERGFIEGFGKLSAVTVAADGVYADLGYLKSHPSAAIVAEAAERFPNDFGLSHNAEGILVKGPDGKMVVESISAVRSVDIVGKPATNRGLFESVSLAEMEANLTEEHRRLGADAHAQAKGGHNPPNWAVDEAKWESAKEAAAKQGRECSADSGDGCALVTHIYQQMGGAIQGKAKESVQPQSKVTIFERRKLRDVVRAAPDSPIKAILIEQDMMGMGDTVVQVPRDGSTDKKLKTALEKMLLGIFNDDSLDTAATVKKMHAALKAYDKLYDLGAPGDGKPPPVVEKPAEPPAEETKPAEDKAAYTESEKPMPDTKTEEKPAVPTPPVITETVEPSDTVQKLLESTMAEAQTLKAENEKLRGQLAEIHKHQSIRALLENTGREVTPARVQTLAALPDSLWKLTVDSWPSKEDRKRPVRTTTGAPLVEQHYRPAGFALTVDDFIGAISRR